MLKNDIGINAGIIWKLLSEKGLLTIREIGEFTNFKDSMICYALGWLSRENKINFIMREDTIYITIKNSLERLT